MRFWEKNIDSQKSTKNLNAAFLYDENRRRKSKAMATIGGDMVQVKIVIYVKVTEYTKENCFRYISVWVISDCLACTMQFCKTVCQTAVSFMFILNLYFTLCYSAFG
jgi:formate hydrogenlyase subunit 6/NADH:ubiquinone oxidoreductase subunit I